MNISFNWLKDFVEIKRAPEKVAEDLTMLGTEVEEITSQDGDTIFKLEVTPNRGDLLSHLGVARELSALYRTPLNSPLIKKKRGRFSARLRVKIKNTVPKLCPRYTYCIIENVELKNSSDLIKKRLKCYGFRALNNIVDITNYVMIEMGQPLHAFDLEKIRKIASKDIPEIIIRQARAKEKVVTLDGQPRYLPEGAIVYEVNGTLIDLAGIMGGLNSEVDEGTKIILLQGAIFDPVTIRYTSKKLNHITDASYRYERGVDYEKGEAGVSRAAELIVQTCRKAKVGEVEDIIYKKPEQIKIEYSPKEINRYIGINVSAVEMEKIFEAEGIQPVIASPQRASQFLNNKKVVSSSRRQSRTSRNDKIVRIPSWRYDLHIWQDLAEEIARYYGYNRIKAEPIKQKKIDNTKTDWYQMELLKDKLVEWGLTEVENYSFISADDVSLFNIKKNNLIEVKNPVAEDIKYLRPSLLPGLIKTVAKNPEENRIEIFEIGHIYKKSGEEAYLGIVLAGKRAKKTAEILLKLKKRGLEPKEIQTLRTSADTLKSLKIRKKEVRAVEISLRQFLRKKPFGGSLRKERVIKYREISRYPSLVRDVAFVVAKKTDALAVGTEIKGLDEKIKKVELFDEYESSKFGKGKKNIAFHLTFQAADHTLNDQEGNKIFEKIVSHIEDKFKGQLRKR